MNCHAVAPLMNAYVDAELAAAERQHVQTHLEACAPCALKASELSALREALASGPLYHFAPGTLRGRVETALATVPASTSVFNQPLSVSSAIIVSVGFVLLAAGVWFSWPIIFTQKPVTLAHHTLALYQRAVEAEKQVACPSSDARVVGKWLKEKTQQDINVQDLSKHGFVLQGGRVETHQSANVPVLVYARDGHSVDLYFWPAHCGNGLRCSEICSNGCHLSGWAGPNGHICWAVTQLPQECLREFATAAGNKTGAGH